MKLLLHACCGPCSLEPVRLLQDAGYTITLAYANSNIHPEDEYRRRLDTLRAWAEAESIPVLELPYQPSAWEDAVASYLPGKTSAVGVGDDVEAIAASDEASDYEVLRQARCRACYRLRLEEVARTAADLDFDALSTTLSVSPYQYIDAIQEELGRAAALTGIGCVFEDFRPFYTEATRRSRELGMYRQNYCGCHISQAEAEHERAERKRERAERKRAREAEHNTRQR